MDRWFGAIDDKGELRSICSDAPGDDQGVADELPPGWTIKDFGIAEQQPKGVWNKGTQSLEDPPVDPDKAEMDRLKNRARQILRDPLATEQQKLVALSVVQRS